MSDETQDGVIFTPKIEEEGRIDELPTVDTNDSSILTPEEIAKFSPAPEENTEELPGEEPKELTEEEKKELFIKQLKESKIRFRPIKHFAVKSTTVVTEELDVVGRRMKRTATQKAKVLQVQRSSPPTRPRPGNRNALGRHATASSFAIHRSSCL